jgi:hypothetical protein
MCNQIAVELGRHQFFSDENATFSLSADGFGRWRRRWFVRSRLGRGTRFSLVPPQDRAALAAISSTTTLENSGGRILVIEDNAAVCQPYEMMLAFSGYEVRGAGTGELPLALVAEEVRRFDSILADQRLGAGLTGTQTASLCVIQA